MAAYMTNKVAYISFRVLWNRTNSTKNDRLFNIVSPYNGKLQGELSQWLCHDDSTIYIVVVIIIIIIITTTITTLSDWCLYSLQLERSNPVDADHNRGPRRWHFPPRAVSVDFPTIVLPFSIITRTVLFNAVSLTKPVRCKQDAQLSQRDRTAQCVIVFAKSTTLELGDNHLRTL